MKSNDDSPEQPAPEGQDPQPVKRKKPDGGRLRKKGWPDYDFVPADEDPLLLMATWGLMAFKVENLWIPLIRDFALILIEQLQEERRNDGRIVGVPVSAVLRKIRWLCVTGDPTQRVSHSKAYHMVAETIFESLVVSRYVTEPAPGYVIVSRHGRARLVSHRKLAGKIIPALKRMIFANADVSSVYTNDATSEKSYKKTLVNLFRHFGNDFTPLMEQYAGGNALYRRMVRKRKKKVAKPRNKL